MSHLNSERLAALSDDTPTPIESAHITTCDACSAEIAAYRRLMRLAVAAQSATSAPLSNFDALLPRLRAEGLTTAPARRRAIRVWTSRIAASLVLVSGGAVAGRMTATKELPMLPRGETLATAAGTAAAVTAVPTTFKSVDDAALVLSASQQSYQNAAAFIAAQDTASHFVGMNQNAYRTRLAVLDQMLAATRTGLYQAPQDPVLNQAFLATQGAREATIRQYSQVLPTKRLERQ
jgi:anti-sigma factor RsiW